MRLTRHQCEKDNKPATKSEDYQYIGKKVNESLAYTYFYPVTKVKGDYLIHFPWENESQFRRRFLSSYASTALSYPQQTADEGLLHEVEFLSPRTLDEGNQVYLVGYVFEKGCDSEWTKAWQQACHQLQFGGERGYGWGDVRCVEMKSLEKQDDKYDLFNGQADFIDNQDQPIIQIQAKRLLAHASSAKGLIATGEIEPLVGREWKVSNQAGQHVEQFCSDLCWVPGSVVEQSLHFKIANFGLWHDTDQRDFR
ncbi:hypothetical protein [Leptothermofonsia sp. ETS-13]|uniref:hypothetical protein n=1 Tax=Leptothermofonsia sp. ETS-13 TaxID=3035696 RepID=UPI003BA323DE